MKNPPFYGGVPFLLSGFCVGNGQVAIGTFEVELWGKPVAQAISLRFRKVLFPKTGKLLEDIGIFVFFEQILY